MAWGSGSLNLGSFKAWAGDGRALLTAGLIPASLCHRPTAEIFPVYLMDWEGDKARLEMLRLAGQAAAAIKMLASCRLGFAVGLY